MTSNILTSLKAEDLYFMEDQVLHGDISRWRFVDAYHMTR